MKRALITLCVGFVLCAPASAKELSGRLGVGLEQSISGVSGLALRYFVSDIIAFNSVLGVDISVVDDGDGGDDVATGLVTSLGLAVHIARSRHAHLGLGLRGSVGWRSAAAQRVIDPAATEAGLHFALEVPLFVEFFLSDHFSIGAATGLLFTFVPDSGAVLDGDGAGGTTRSGAVGIGIGAGSVTGTLSILYYF